MDLYIMDDNFDIIGIIDDASSVLWVPRYNAVGDFEIYAAATPRNISLLQSGHYVKRWDDDMVGIIKTINVKTDIENGNYITVSGPDLKDILRSRVVWIQHQLTGSLYDCIKTLINSNVISPIHSVRKIKNFVIAPNDTGLIFNITKQVTGGTVYDAIVELCESCGCGFKVILNGKTITFVLCAGKDRSVNQKKLPVVMFSPHFDNLANTEYTFNLSKYANAAIVAGEGEGIERRTMLVGDSEGLSRYETYIDARDVSSNGGQIGEIEYSALLTQRGLDKLSEMRTVETFTGETINNLTYTYREDYGLGDIVTVENEYGIRANVRIDEVVENEDETGHKIIPSFKNWRLI